MAYTSGSQPFLMLRHRQPHQQNRKTKKHLVDRQ
jgi:hypothetical protein